MTVDHKAFFDAHPDRYGTLLLRERWPRNQIVKARLIGEALGPEPVGLVVDIGCGTGQIGEALLEEGRVERYLGIDPSPATLERARARLGRFAERVDLVESYAEAIALSDETADAAFGVDLIHHLADPARAMDEIRRILRPGGAAVFLESNVKFPVTFLIGLSTREERGMFRTSKRLLASLMQQAGFTNVRVDYAPLFTPPGPPALVPLYAAVDRLLWLSRIFRPMAIFYRVTGARGGDHR